VSGGSNCVPRKGYICLESEGSECHFRNIRIMELPSSNPSASEVAEEDKGFRSLYNGLDLRGWKQDQGHAGHWRARDWILDYDGASEASDKRLWSEQSFRDFELIIDWRSTSKLPANGDSAICLRGAEMAKVKIDGSSRPPGQWNRFFITMRGDRLTVALNDKTVSENVELPGIPASGPIGLQHYGSPIQFANIYIRELK
jgi:hypothetical protein